MHTIGYYTGWAIAIVLLFMIPLMVVFIEYLKRMNRRLTDIQKRLSLLTGEAGKSVKDGKGDAELE